MKKLFFKFTSMIFVSLIVLSFSACGNDVTKDIVPDNQPTETSTSLIGKWKFRVNDRDWLVEFKSDNTGTSTEHGQTNKILYTFNKDTNRLKIIHLCDDGQTVNEETVVLVEFINNNSMVWYPIDDKGNVDKDKVITVTRITEDNSNEEDEVTILGTWRCYTDKAKGYYYQITLEEDGTLIWNEIDDNENETSYCTYTYEDGYITWYEKENDIEAIWYVSQLDKTEMITYRVNKYTGELDKEKKNIWVKIK